MLFATEVFNNDLVIPFVCRSRKGQPCFEFLQTSLFQNLLFWYQQVKQRLKLVQNTAARLLMRSQRSDHITLIHATLHLLLVIFRTDFKILLTLCEIHYSIYNSMDNSGFRNYLDSTLVHITVL